MKKHSLPFSDAVTQYFKSNPNEYLDIHCGPKAYRESLWDSYYPDDVAPSLCLPYMHDFKMYWWPVRDLTSVLNWSYPDTSRQIEFANYLVHTCGALEVFTLIDGDLTKFMDTYQLANGRLAA